MTQLVAPLSLKQKKFQDIVDIDNGVLSKDYCYGNAETWKFSGKTNKGSTFDYEAKFDAKNDLSVSMSDTLKFKFPFQNNNWIWIGIRRNGELKFHWDGGMTKIHGHDFNFFGNFKTCTQFK